jgi:hypothetical protein
MIASTHCILQILRPDASYYGTKFLTGPRAKNGPVETLGFDDNNLLSNRHFIDAEQRLNCAMVISDRYDELGIPKPDTALVPICVKKSTLISWYSKLSRMTFDELQPDPSTILVAVLVIGSLATAYAYVARDLESFWQMTQHSSQVSQSLSDYRPIRSPERFYNGFNVDEKISSPDSSLQTIALHPDTKSETPLTPPIAEADSEPVRDSVASKRWPRPGLQRARTQMRKRRLTTPTGDNAFETFKSILSVNPKNQEALYGIYKIKRAYQQWGLDAELQGDLEKAKIYYSRALHVAPNDTVVATAMQSVDKKLVLNRKYGLTITE